MLILVSRETLNYHGFGNCGLAAPGGRWEERDPVSRGRVQILPAGPNPVTQALSVMTEFRRLADLAPDWHWSRCAVIAREWEYLVPVRAFCEQHGMVRVQLGNVEM